MQTLSYAFGNLVNIRNIAQLAIELKPESRVGRSSRERHAENTSKRAEKVGTGCCNCLVLMTGVGN